MSCEAWTTLANTYARPSWDHIKQIKGQLKQATKASQTITKYMWFIKTRVDKLTLLSKPMDDEDLIEKILDELDCEYKSIIDTVEALRSNDPCSCQVDARFQPRLSSGSVVPQKMSG